jgi:hypothetical protein
MRLQRPDGYDDAQVHLRFNDFPGPAGTLEFFNEDGVVAKSFHPPQEFQLLKWLAEETVNAAMTPGATGYVKTATLARRLYFGNFAVEEAPHVVIDAIHRLRKRLDEIDAAIFIEPDPDGRLLGMRLVEGRRHFGFRLNFPPERIHLPRPQGDD